MKIKRDIRRVMDKALPILGSKEITAKWIVTENPCFDGLTPAQMIAKGKKGKVIRMIEKYDRNYHSAKISNVD